ncbi:MAG: NAD(P)H-dependent glycerol-3-phosphate dehydrogenase [Pseudomonadota bacterium]
MSADDMTARDPAPSDRRASAVRPYGRVAVLGAGAWGTALAVIAARAGRPTRLWARDPDQARAMAESRVNARRLPGIDLPDALAPASALADALDGAEAVLMAVPSAAVRDTARALRGALAPHIPVCLAAKGIEPGSGLLMTEVAAQELAGNPLAVLSGPNFADETALGHPTATTIASECGPVFRRDPGEAVAARLAVTLSTESFRPYVSDDLVGVEVGGAVKNVVAIAAGIAQGAGFGANTRAALVTRGLEEMKQLAEALGGRRETVTGLSGMGDLTLTCSSEQSRNFRLGQQLGRGLARDACFEGAPVTVEGERAARSVTDLARKHALELPICEAMRAVLHEGELLPAAFGRLWGRSLKAEPKALDFELGHPAADGAVAYFEARFDETSA